MPGTGGRGGAVLQACKKTVSLNFRKHLERTPARKLRKRRVFFSKHFFSKKTHPKDLSRASRAIFDFSVKIVPQKSVLALRAKAHPKILFRPKLRQKNTGLRLSGFEGKTKKNNFFFTSLVLGPGRGVLCQGRGGGCCARAGRGGGGCHARARRGVGVPR